jgi:hypothetical protein
LRVKKALNFWWKWTSPAEFLVDGILAVIVFVDVVGR